MYATGHYRNGVLLAPLTAQLVADAMLDNRIDPLLAAVEPARGSGSTLTERRFVIGDRRVSLDCRRARRADGSRAPNATTTAIRSASSAAGATKTSAIERLTRWLDWQREHAAALEALQQAERAYHRTIAGSAFASPTEGPSAIELQKESLEAVEAARVRLDEVRARRNRR